MAEGVVFKYGNNVDTDVIIPARYLNTSDAKALAEHCMVDIDPTFVTRMKPGDIVVGGDNFGCGSSREHAPLALKTCGVSCVIANTFARIFYRNSINIGFAIIECPEAVADISEGDTVRVDFDKGTIENLTTGHSFTTKPFPPFLKRIIDAGGLLPAISEDMQ